MLGDVNVGGNVGIGKNPSARLDVNGDIKVNDNKILLRGDMNHGIRYIPEPDGPILFGWGGGYLGTARDPALGGYMVALTWNKDGNVGIGTKNPSAKLEVNGDLKVTGDVILTNADCAEDFDITCAEPVEPGTVMIIDNGGALKPSSQAYDRRVAGVISGAGDFRPGITLDKRVDRANRLPLALTGKVYCKIDAQYGPVGLGDMLTTSPTYGHAMKADDPFKAFGSVIGKALRPMETGRGIIPILIALQ